MRRVTCAAGRAIAAFGIAVSAQKTTEMKTGSGGSPHVRTDWVIDRVNFEAIR